MIKRNQFLKILTLHFEPSTKKIFKLNMANYILKSWKNPQFNADNGKTTKTKKNQLQ